MFDLDQEIKGAKRIGIAGHIRPDGDCVGSCLGLGLYLRENYPELEAVDIHLESVPEKFRVLEGTETICTSYPEKTYDVFFSLDCGDIGRLGNAAEYLKTAGKVICVDHHISNHGFGDVQFIEPAASSTSELIYLLLDDAELSVSAAKALYMGIAHDTGVFQYSCTGRRTMEIAGKLMEKGFDFNELLDQTFFQKTYLQNQILGRALLESMLLMDGKCIISALRKKDLDFYGVTGEQYLIKDGDFLALGRHKLRFYLTPMVHWPETMMTFDETDGVLFSGDGFGCFGTLDGGFVDTRMNIDHYWGEMVRYYSNIVGKYGSPVQKALQKLGGLPISTICSTHGPVWTENITKVVGIYDKLSRYDADEGVVIAYGSMYGNTEQMAEAIAAELSAQGIKNIVMHNVSKSNPSYILADIFRYKGLIVGSPTYSNQIFPEIESLLSKILVRELKGRYLGYFGSFTWAGAAVKRMAEFAEKSKFELVGDPVEMKQAMNDITYQQCENLARAMADRLKKDRV